MLPLDKMRVSSSEKFAETDPLFLQYGYISGYPLFRQVLAKFLAKGYNQEVDPEHLFVTNGISGSLGLLCSLFVSKGDVIVVEEPSYFLALNIFRDFGLEIVSVGMDSNGMKTDELEAKLTAGLRPKVIYTIPSFHNPTGYTLSDARRKHLVSLASTYNFLVFADEVYQLLAFDNVPPPPPVLCYYDTTGHVLSMGSFAKIAAPALRLGWFQVSKHGAKILKRIYDCGQLDSSGGLNPIISGMVEKFIHLGYQEQHIVDVRKELTTRASILGDALRKHLPPSATFIQPTGGYFIWITLPPGIQGTALLDECVANHKVRFHPGVRFGTGLEQYIRLSFSYYNANDLAIGAERLGNAMKVMISKQTGVPSAIPDTSSERRLTPNLAIQGATGRLGSLIVQSVTSSSIASKTNLNLIGTIGRNEAVPVDADVIIDVSSPHGTETLVNSLLTRAQSSSSSKPPALVVGTTGASLPMESLKKYAAFAPVVLCANFSAGVPLMLSMIDTTKDLLQKKEWQVEVTEQHHIAKVDAPSGTAKRILGALESAGLHGLHKDHTIPCHSMRLGDTVGIHTVHLAGPGERIEITHTATKREVFAVGALRIAAWASVQPKGFYIK
jgi:2-aminoadipate transaminase